MWLWCVRPETQIFVDKLFEAVGNRSYLPPSEQQAPVNKLNPKLEKDDVKKEEVICVQSPYIKQRPRLWHNRAIRYVFYAFFLNVQDN